MALILAVAHLLGFVSSIHAVMGTRTSQGAIAWAVSLNAFPYLSVPAYLREALSAYQLGEPEQRGVWD